MEEGGRNAGREEEEEEEEEGLTLAASGVVSEHSGTLLQCNNTV